VRFTGRMRRSSTQLADETRPGAEYMNYGSAATDAS